MSVTFKCPTGGEEYPVEISVTGHAYYRMSDSKLISLNRDHQDCCECEDELKQITNGLEDSARAAIRERRKAQNG